TGYHPKHVSTELLTGLALQHDLGLLIEWLSETLDIPVRSLAEPVLGIDDVTERFNVTSKTIQRWRRRGLPARRFIFPDGKMRVAFLLCSVEKFLSLRRDQLAACANFASTDGSMPIDDRDRLTRLLNKKIRFIDDPLYHQPDAQSAIDAIVNQEVLADASHDRDRIPHDLPPYLQELYRVPL